jgi:hypothetical protein
MEFKIKTLFVVFAFMLVAGCAHDSCNNVPQRPQTADVPPAVEPGGFGRNVQSDSASLPPDAVLISKPTGELQCGQGKATPLDDVLKTLRSKKIKVYEAHTQSDGMVHMDLCGSPKGEIHVVAIAKKDLKKALKLGFQEKKAQ